MNAVAERWRKERRPIASTRSTLVVDNKWALTRNEADNPSREAKSSGANGDGGKFIFSGQPYPIDVSLLQVT